MRGSMEGKTESGAFLDTFRDPGRVELAKDMDVQER